MAQQKKPQSEIGDKSSHTINFYQCANSLKADFVSIYNQPDPRAYFSTLSQFDYLIPEMACPVLRATLNRLRTIRGRDNLHVVDLGCSYGINAALLKRGLSMRDLYDHYLQARMTTADSATVAEQDRHFFGRHAAHGDLTVIGLDVAEQAVKYAEQTGLVDRGAVADLESGPPSSDLESLLAPADIVVSTGCVGYVTETTFGRVLDAVSTRMEPWVACFVLRMFPYDDIAEKIAAHGLVTEKLEGVLFPQRKFATPEEGANVLATLRGMGIDSTGLEDVYGFLAEFYLSRPRKEAENLPLRDLIPRRILPERAVLLPHTPV